MVNRRQFLGGAAGALGGAAGASLLAPFACGSDILGANESISLGFIGLGVRGGRLLDAFKKIDGVRIAALCDPDRKRLQETAAKFPKAQTFVDLREVIDDPSIDAVVIATGNHWHCLAAILACRAGKDVYVEKPLGHNLAEQEALVKVAGETGRLVQIGTQQRSDPAHMAARRWLHKEKALGELTRVIACRAGQRPPIGARRTPLPIPPSTDYALWLGPAKKEPLFRDNLHYDWHWDWNTGSGEMGNWGVHIIDDLRSVALRDNTELPKRVVSAGARVGWNDAGETPNLQTALFTGAGVPVLLLLSNLEQDLSLATRFGYRGPATGYVVHGEGGTLAAQRGKFILRDRSGAIMRQRAGNSGVGHQRNFIKALRSRSADVLNAPLEQGHASSSWCHLANIAALQGYAYRHGPEADYPAEWAALSRSLKAEADGRSVDPIPTGQITTDEKGRIATSGLTPAALNLVTRNDPTEGFDPLKV